MSDNGNPAITNALSKAQQMILFDNNDGSYRVLDR
jgi:hypothetical protein